MKLLIAEDEPFVRERIAKDIDWNAANIELVTAVSNGKEAAAIMRQEHLDILVTDIQMPDMNGLELAEWVKRHYPSVKVIILTGYDVFEYAQKSIEHGVCKFLVKPVSNGKLLEAVLEAKAARERELAEHHNVSLLERRWQEHLPHLQDAFLKNWLSGRASAWELERWSGELELGLEDRQIWPVAVDMDPITDSGGRFLPQDRPLVQFALFTIARDLLAGPDCLVAQDDDGITAVLFTAAAAESPDAWQQHVLHWVDMLLGVAKNCLKLTASAGIGMPVQDRTLLPVAYKQSRMALRERVVLGNGMIIRYRDNAVVTRSWKELNRLEKELELAIEAGDGDMLEEAVRQLIQTSFAPDNTVADAKEMLLRTVCLLTKIIHSNGWTLHETLGEDYEDFEGFYRLITRDQIGEWLSRMTRRISLAILERRQSGTQATVSEVLRWIHDHLDREDLSLSMIAGRLYVNYSYLSRLFKKVTGESFSEYVLRIRMERAKELLASGMKVYDAASRVGFRHVNYFSKAFAKHWGIKPSEVYKTQP